MDKLFRELGLPTLKPRHWIKKLCLSYKVFHSKSPGYLFVLVPENNYPYASRSALNNQFPFFNLKTNYLKYSFFPVLTKWSRLYISICNSSSCRVFKTEILKFIRPYSRFCNCNHPMIYQICDAMMSIITWERVHVWIYFWTTTRLVTKLDQLIDISKGNNFPESFEQFGGLGLSSRSFLI